MTTDDGLTRESHRIDYVLTADDYAAFNTHVSLTIPETLRQLAQARIWGAAVIAVFIGLLGTAVFEEGIVVALVLAALGAVAWWVISPRVLRREVRRSSARIARTSGLGVLGPGSLSADEVGLRGEGAGVVNIAPWAAVERVEETAAHGFIFIGPVGAFVVPKRTEGAQAMLSVVRERIGVDPRAA